jgi:hypothetical protein
MVGERQHYACQRQQHRHHGGWVVSVGGCEDGP